MSTQPLSTTPKSSRQTFWLVAIAIFFLAANMRAPIVALGSVAPIIQNALSISESYIGWLGAVPMLMFAIGSLISPAIGKRFGLENTLIVSLVVITAGIIIRSMWVSWTGFLIGTLLFSLAIGFANTLGAPIIKQHTPQHIAVLTSVYSLTMTLVAGGVAGVVYPLSAAMGWQWGLGIWALMGVAAIIVWVVMRLKLGSSHRLSTVELGSRSIPSPAHISVWKSPLAWQLAVFMGIQSLLFYTVASFLPSIWQDKGLTPLQAGHMATVYQWLAPITVIVLTWLVKRGVSAKMIGMVSSIVNLIAVIGMAYLSTNLAWLWSGMMGMGCAGIFTLCLLLFSVRTDTPQQASRLSGMVQAVGYVIAFFGPLMAGWLHEHQQSWDLPLFVLIILMAVNIIFAWLVGRPVMLDGRAAARAYQN